MAQSSQSRFSLPTLAMLAMGGAAAVVVLASNGAEADEAMRRVPAPPAETAAAAGPQTAVLAGGCFWGVEGVFEHVRGVTHVESGYAGGQAKTATYDEVSGGRTGHAESVRITYDPSQITYGEILQIYFSVAHDPTQLDRQGPDHGTQYRSAIFAQTPAQAAEAKRYIQQLDGAKTYGKPLVTRIETGAFYPAEEYHQDFMARNPAYPYIVVNDRPKVEALQKFFPERYRTEVAAKAG
ncbi:peptide-methionine (S)-S-oxide reductase MsrA [Aureimonas jatrophae]|jgi:peptide-methionine (S)-S-oxide reductase|uniref:Peptide methionine sulfoxide reductase MsrA n=1 Tax=Aureimonas jatrophae TaxID=1166073 RepID=A0A1H0DC26_9HYPH|nr:peptide-methionine (S)-S-oxide reductase MsrA [Aureimonas jatrophae]MBB3951802.1 peptide-methionine (S)-S-oxide reductase [Aureimonas jatrophae]SDN67511.1 peptide-methionine (S)-S-oxide reductase [Aureimonas jatrophae]